MSGIRRILDRQDWHLALLALLLVSLRAVMARAPELFRGELWNIGSGTWVWIGVVAAVLHQVYVMLVWRTQLETGWLTLHLPRVGMLAYTADVTILILARILAVIFLAGANRGSLPAADPLRLTAAILLAVPFCWLLYSLFRYFGIKRAFGLDHFDPTCRGKPYVRKGIFRYSVNAFYTFGMTGFYLPGLLYGSAASLILALFYHLYAWIHYYCTELPDIRRIYGPSAQQPGDN